MDDAAPACPRIEDDQMVYLRWRDAQGRRCSTWRTAQEIGDLIEADSKQRSIAIAIASATGEGA